MYQIKVCGIPCQAKVTHWTKYVPARIHPVDYSHPEEGGDVEFELYDRKGYRARWLEKKMESCRGEEDRIAEELYYMVEADDEH